MSDLPARLDRLPISSFHKMILILVGCGMFLDAFDNYLANSVLSSLLEDGWTTLQLNAWFISCTSIGMLIGSIIAGYLADKYGRKAIYQINMLIFGIAALVCAIAPDMYWLIGFRFLTGIGMGAELVVGYGMLGEFVPPSHRGRWGALMSFISQFGLLASTFASWLIIPIAGWRAMFVIAGIGGLIVYLVRRKYLPESPRWLSKQGKEVEAISIVQHIETTYYNGELNPVPCQKPQKELENYKISVFDRRFRSRIFLGSLMMVVQSVSIYGFVAWLPSLMVSQGMSVQVVLAITVLMAFGGPVGALLAYSLADLIGRKPAIILGSLAAAAAGLMYSVSISQFAATSWGFITFTLIYFLVSVIQAGYIPELFPTEVRMRLSCVCIVAGRITAIIMPFCVVYLYQTGGMLMVASTVAGLLCIQAVATMILGIETRNMSLEDI